MSDDEKKRRRKLARLLRRIKQAEADVLEAIRGMGYKTNPEAAKALVLPEKQRTAIETSRRQHEIRIAASTDTVEYAAQHYPVRISAVRDPEGNPDGDTTGRHSVRSTLVRRRLCHATLWDNLTPDQQNAAEQIDYAWRLLAKGLGYKSMSFRRTEQGRSQVDHETAALLALWDWQKLSREKNGDQKTATRVRLVRDVLIEECSFKEVAKRYRIRKAVVGKILRDMLDLYVEANPRRFGRLRRA